MADFWTKNANVFRRLYQDERKTLHQVKEFAERELHPPENYTSVQRLFLFQSRTDLRARISTYETKLRDVLKLRKKLKQRDWYLIHHYALSRGLGRREYDVLLNGTQMRPDQVWKEIRRYGYHKETEGELFDQVPVHLRGQRKALTHLCQVCKGSLCPRVLRSFRGKG
jgi:hypothetical protein